MTAPVRPITAELLTAGLAALRREESKINDLNVFPVPDGDTGTNLVMTVEEMCAQLQQLGDGSYDGQLKAIALGSLMGARGNSGVILSQIVRGVCERLASANELDVVVVTEALAQGSDVAYQAIRKPVEGTMLTVMRDAARAAALALNNGERDLGALLEVTLREAGKSVARTPELLPVLKESNVVDAGGYGLVVLGQGILAALLGRAEEAEALVGSVGTPVATAEIDLDYRYCTEFLVFGEELDKDQAEEFLESLGESIMVGVSKGVMHVHVHTNNPGGVIEWATGKGGLAEVKIDDMVLQSKKRAEALTAVVVEEGTGIVAVGNGEGVVRILESLGVDRVVDGGQTMNPSVAELAQAVNAVPREDVIILPNNPNIVLTAQQVHKRTDRNVYVVPTKTIPEAFAALLAVDDEADIDTNARGMSEAAQRVKTCEITHAVRSGRAGPLKFRRGDLIGMCQGEIRVVGRKLSAAALRLLEEALAPTDTALTLLVGHEADEKEVEKLLAKLRRKHPRLEVDVQDGDQPLYPLIAGIE